MWLLNVFINILILDYLFYLFKVFIFIIWDSKNGKILKFFKFIFCLSLFNLLVNEKWVENGYEKGIYKD